jgi:tRNA(adenine34) deaminase
MAATQDEFFMRVALDEARRALEEDEVPVGAIVVRGVEILARDHNRVRERCSATAHGEMLVLDAAAKVLGDWRLHECTLYTTKEPCPMCAGACIMSRIGRVVFAVSDPLMGCFGGSTCNFSAMGGFNHHPAVSSGILADECLEILRYFFMGKRALHRRQKAEMYAQNCPCDSCSERLNPLLPE